MKVASYAGGDPPFDGRPLVARALESWRGLTPVQLLIPAAMGLVWGLGNTWAVDRARCRQRHAQCRAFRVRGGAGHDAAVAGPGAGRADRGGRRDCGPPSARPYAVAALVAAIGAKRCSSSRHPSSASTVAAATSIGGPRARASPTCCRRTLIAVSSPPGTMPATRCATRRCFARGSLEDGPLARRTLESKLRTMQARVEPEFLFDTLVEIERLYARTVPRQSHSGPLVVYLGSASTVARCDLHDGKGARTRAATSPSAGSATPSFRPFRTGRARFMLAPDADPAADRWHRGRANAARNSSIEHRRGPGRRTLPLVVCGGGRAARSGSGRRDRSTPSPRA